MELVKEFLAYIQKNKRQSKRTVEAYERSLDKFFAFHADYADVDKIVIQNYIGQNQNSASTINNELSAIKMFYKYLIDTNRFSGENPADNVDRPKMPHREPKFLNKNETDILLYNVLNYEKQKGAKLPERSKAIMLLFMMCGLRKEEIQMLKMKNDKVDTLHVIGKGDKERKVPIHPTLREALDKYYIWRKTTGADSEFMFVTMDGTPLSIDCVESAFYKFMKTIERTDLSPHKIRHTFATRLADNGVHAKTIQALMGHASIMTTNIYVHASDQGKANAINNLF